MPIDLQTALGAELPEQRFRWTASDVALYNLGVGACADPLDVTALSYVDDAAPKVPPTFATVAATFHTTEAPRVRFPGVDIDLAKVVHGHQQVTVHRPLPAAGEGVTRTRIAEIHDKGSAAVIIQESTTTTPDGEPLWTARSGIFARGEGGFGGDRGPSNRLELPDRAPDHVLDEATLARQALLYRLCGDRNPLHSDPAFARAAGFPRPILHGLCTYGTVCRTVIDRLLDGETAAATGFSAKFAGVVFPGETLRIEVWEDGERLVGRASVVERDEPALGDVVLTRT